MPEAPDFSFDHRGLFLIPAEALSAEGLDPGFRQRLCARGRATPEWVERFGQAFALYWQRALELSAHAPRHWLPPRVQNVCVALDPVHVRPFFQPLGAASCLLDQGDFEPRSSSLEFSAYQFFQVERRGLLRTVVPALQHDLSYWMVRSPAELRDFQAGCRRAAEGQARGWRALARALDWIQDGFHDTLKPPPASVENLEALPGTGVWLPTRLRRELESLLRSWSAAAEERVQRHRAAHAPRSGQEAAELLSWLAEERPLVLVTGGQGEILWEPEAPEQVQRLEPALRAVSAAAAARLREDWSLIHARSRAFLDSLTRPAELPAAGAGLEQSGLAYLYSGRRQIAYNLDEPGMQRLSEPAPPFERWMLAARTIHEWGHLAVDAGWVPVPAARQREFAAVRAELEARFNQLVQAAPGALRAHAAARSAELERRSGTVGAALVELLLGRMSDWQSNLLAQRYLSSVESETYVRNNVRPLLGELDSSQLFQALARYAFEYQYLAFGQAQRGYFLSITWFEQQFLARGVLTHSELEELFDAVARLCRCHEIDETRFAAPPAGGRP